MSGRVPVPELSPNELRSRKRARGTLCQDAGTPLVCFRQKSFRTRDGNVWHADPNPNLPRFSSPHIVPPGSLTQQTNVKTLAHEFFELFLPDEVFAEMVLYTNLKIVSLRRKYKQNNKATTSDTCIAELKALVGILVMSGLKSDNHVSTKVMWDPFDGCPLYRSAMSSARFVFLMRALRFDSAQTREARVARDRLAPVRSIWDTFISACRNCYVPGPHLTIDEQLVPFRGNVAFKMYIPNKPAK